MTTHSRWKQPVWLWTGFEEKPGHPRTCILRTHPALFSGQIVGLILVCSLMVLASLSGPGLIWGGTAFLLFVLSMALPQTLIFESDAPMFTHIIGFEHFGIRFMRPRSSVRGLMLIVRTWKRYSSTHVYVAWNGIGLPALLASDDDYSIAQEYADYVSSEAGLPKLSVDQEKEAATIRLLRSRSCLSILFCIDVLWVWLSKGSMPLDTYFRHARGNFSAAPLFFPMTTFFLPIMVVEAVQAAFDLAKTRKQGFSPEVWHIGAGTGAGIAEMRDHEQLYVRLRREYGIWLAVLGVCVTVGWLYEDELGTAWVSNPGVTNLWVSAHFGILVAGTFLLRIIMTFLPMVIHGLIAASLELGWIRKDISCFDRVYVRRGRGGGTAASGNLPRKRKHLRTALYLGFIFLELVAAVVTNDTARTILFDTHCLFFFMALNLGFMIVADVMILRRMRRDNGRSETATRA